MTLSGLEFDLGDSPLDELDDQQVDDSNSSGSASDTADQKPPTAGAGQVDETAPIPGGGPLLEEASPKKVFTMIHREIQSQKRLARNRNEEDVHYDSVRRGVGFSYLEKSEDRSIIKRALPPGIDDTTQPIPNKIDDLCNKIVSQILVDPFLPNPKPDGDSDRNRGAADLMKKFLRQVCGANGINLAEALRWMLTTNITRCAAFEYLWVDPTGGGWRPMQKKAHPQATDPKNPLMGPRLVNGQPALDANQQPILEKTSDPVLRYVAEVDDPDSPLAKLTRTPQKKLVFTKNASEAKRQWLPSHRNRHLTRAQVRTVPRSATVRRADQVLVLYWESVREAKRRFTVLDGMDEARIKQLCTWKPKEWKTIVPEAMWPKGDDSEGGTDDSLLFWYISFCRIGDEYQDGGEVHVNGYEGGVILKRDTLREDVELEDGTTIPILMDPPIAEFIALQDTADRGDPQGRCPIAVLEGSGALFAHLYLALIQVLDRGLNPNIYMPSTSTVTREDINRRDGTPIDILTSEDKPFYEVVPELPAGLDKFMQRVEVAMNSAAQTNETSNGLDSRYSQSGVAKQVALSVAKTLLSQYWQNTVDGVTSIWRIAGQLAQARITVPQMVSLSGGEDSAYKERYFVGSDLYGISDYALSPGSGSMMNGPEKVKWLQSMAQGDVPMMDPELAGELARACMADDLGLPPNVHEEHINRCIAEWVDGPSKQWTDQYAQQQQGQAQYAAKIKDLITVMTARGVDPQAAQQQATQAAGPAPQFPPLPTCFEPRPNDTDRFVAKVRAAKLSRLMATVDYMKWGPEWRAQVDTAYTAADAAAKDAPAKGTPQAQYAEFVQKTSQDVVALMQNAMAKVIAGGAAPQPAGSAAKSPGDGAAIEAAKQQGDLRTTAMELQHKATESDKARAFDADQNERDRIAESQHDDKTIGKDLTIAAHREASKPKAVPPGGAPPATPRGPLAPSGTPTPR